MRKFKVAIDVSPLNDGNSLRGVGYYTKNLVSALEKETKYNPDFKHYQIDLITNSQNLDNSYQLIHYPYFDPFKLTLPRTQKPYIVTCHDLIPREFKKNFPVGFKGELKWQIQKRKLEQAKYIICPSHSAKYQILDQINYSADYLYTIYEAADPSFKKIKDTSLLKKIKEKYQLPEKFVFFLGDINWNKNIPNLVTACRELKFPLVIAGAAAAKKVPIHPWTKDIIWLQSQKSADLHLLGFVPDEDLPSLFNLATLYCQPSYSEGFGLPLVQAMQSGTPVCYSQESSLPEIMDFNGEYFDPYSIMSLKKSLIKMWSSPKLRQQYSLAGLKRAQYFSWKNTALQTLALYRFVEIDEEK